MPELHCVAPDAPIAILTERCGRVSAFSRRFDPTVSVVANPHPLPRRQSRDNTAPRTRGAAASHRNLPVQGSTLRRKRDHATNIQTLEVDSRDVGGHVLVSRRAGAGADGLARSYSQRSWTSLDGRRDTLRRIQRRGRCGSGEDPCSAQQLLTKRGGQRRTVGSPTRGSPNYRRLRQRFDVRDPHHDLTRGFQVSRSLDARQIENPAQNDDPRQGVFLGRGGHSHRGDTNNPRSLASFLICRGDTSVNNFGKGRGHRLAVNRCLTKVSSSGRDGSLLREFRNSTTCRTPSSRMSPTSGKSHSGQRDVLSNPTAP